MTLQDLQNRVTLRCLHGYGYIFDVLYRGVTYAVWLPFSPVTDTVKFEDPDYGITIKQAYQYIYDECKKKYGL